MDQRFHTDSLNLFFARQLEYITPRLLDILFAELRAVKYIPVNNEGGPGMENYTYRQYTMLGQAQVIANYANDFRNIGVSGQEFTAYIKPIGDAFEWNFQDMRSAIQGGVNLNQHLANAAMRALAQKENSIGLFGDANYNLIGWFNQPNIPTAVAPADGIGGSTQFSQKTPLQIARDISTLINNITINTKEVEMADTVLMATSTYTYLKSTPMSEVNPMYTILDYLKNTFNDQITTWDTLVELETAGSGDTRMMIAYEKNPDKLMFLIPQPMEFLPLENNGIIWKQRLHERVGGVITPYPLSNNFLTGM